MSALLHHMDSFGNSTACGLTMLDEGEAIVSWRTLLGLADADALVCDGCLVHAEAALRMHAHMELT